LKFKKQNTRQIFIELSKILTCRVGLKGMAFAFGFHPFFRGDKLVVITSK
jgi:hypothetical protein